LAGFASRQASSPETAWSANIAAPDMRGEIARNLLPLSAGDGRQCPPGQAPEAKALPAVGEPLTAGTSSFACVAPAAPDPQSDLAVTQGSTSRTGARLGPSATARAGASLETVSRSGASLNAPPPKAGAALTAAAPSAAAPRPDTPN
jgi:hypothetical protein